MNKIINSFVLGDFIFKLKNCFFFFVDCIDFASKRVQVEINWPLATVTKKSYLSDCQ